MKKIQSEATQNRIQKAVIELLLEKDYEDITISEITEKSKINRTTFYLSYSSKEELVKDIFYTFLNWFMDDLASSLLIEADKNKSMICSDFKKIKKQAGQIKAMLGIRINGFVPYLELQTAIETMVYNQLKGRATEEIVSLVSKKYASNTVTTIEWWIEHYEKYTEEFVYEIIYTCAYEGLFYLLKK